MTPLLHGLSDMADATIDQVARALVKVSGERRKNLLHLLGLTDTAVSALRRFPHKGSNVFAGHFQAVLSRQASPQEVLRHNKRLVAKALPQSTTTISTSGERKASWGSRGSRAGDATVVSTQGPWRTKMSVNEDVGDRWSAILHPLSQTLPTKKGTWQG